MARNRVSDGRAAARYAAADPGGLIYLLLGVLIVMLWGGWVVYPAALLVTMAGMSAAFARRNSLAVRKWVLWAFIAIDLAIILLLGATLAA